MKPNYTLLLLFLPLIINAQENLVPAGAYPWPKFTKSKKNITTPMLTGSAYDLASVNVSAHLLSPGKKYLFQVESSEEHLILIKNGIITITLNDSAFSLGKGSVAMMMPTEKYFLQNNGTASCEFHVMKYKSKLPADLARGKAAGGSFVKDWNKLNFRPHERGGVRSFFERPTANTRRFEMHVTTLKENFKSHDPHRHGAEEIILVLEGQVEMLIGEKSYQAAAGDVLFAPTNIFHGLKNTGKGEASYFAFQWE